MPNVVSSSNISSGTMKSGSLCRHARFSAFTMARGSRKDSSVGLTSLICDGKARDLLAAPPADDDAAGSWGVNWDVAFSTADYCVVAQYLQDGTATLATTAILTSQLAGSIQAQTQNAASLSETGVAGMFVTAFGDT